jgi:hypothetical protein
LVTPLRTFFLPGGTVPLADLPAGTYVLRFTATLASGDVSRREVALEVRAD